MIRLLELAPTKVRGLAEILLDFVIFPLLLLTDNREEVSIGAMGVDWTGGSRS